MMIGRGPFTTSTRQARADDTPVGSGEAVGAAWGSGHPALTNAPVVASIRTNAVDTGPGHGPGVTLGGGAGPHEIGGNEPVRLTSQTTSDAGATPLEGSSSPNVDSRTATTLASEPPGTFPRAMPTASSALIDGWEASTAADGLTSGKAGVARHAAIEATAMN